MSESLVDVIAVGEKRDKKGSQFVQAAADSCPRYSLVGNRAGCHVGIGTSESLTFSSRASKKSCSLCFAVLVSTFVSGERTTGRTALLQQVYDHSIMQSYSTTSSV